MAYSIILGKYSFRITNIISKLSLKIKENK